MPANEANAASYSPMPMPSPMIAHQANNTTGEGAAASNASPAAKIRFDSISTPRPPIRSIRAPAQGPIVAETTTAMENAPNTQTGDRPKLAAIGAARTAGM